MAIIDLAGAKVYLRVDGDDFNTDVQRAMASAEVYLKVYTGKDFSGRDPLAVECALMMTSQFYENRGGETETRFRAMDLGIQGLLVTLSAMTPVPEPEAP